MTKLWKNPLFWVELIEVVIVIANEIRDRMEPKAKPSGNGK